jgi:hypothetical protein
VFTVFCHPADVQNLFKLCNLARGTGFFHLNILQCGLNLTFVPPLMASCLACGSDGSLAEPGAMRAGSFGTEVPQDDCIFVIYFN